jgi:hypothetical protein
VGVDISRSTIWQLHPGDIVFTEIFNGFYKEIARTPNELEAQRILKELERAGRSVIVFQVRGSIP